MTLSLYIDGQLTATRSTSSSTYTEQVAFDVNRLIPRGGGNTQVEVRGNFSSAWTAGTINVQLNKTYSTVTDSITGNSVLPSTIPTSATLTVSTPKLTFHSSTSNPRSHLFASNETNQTLLSFRAEAEDDNIRFKTITFRSPKGAVVAARYGIAAGTYGDIELGFQDFRLVGPNTNISATRVETKTVSGDAYVDIVFEDIPSNTINTISAGQTVTYSLVASTNSDPAVSHPIVVGLVDSTASGEGLVHKFVGSSGTEDVVPSADYNYNSNQHMVKKAKVLVTPVNDSNPTLAGNALKFTVQATGTGGSVQMTEFKIKPNLTSYKPGSLGNIKVYVDNTSSGNVVNIPAGDAVSNNTLVIVPVVNTENAKIDTGSTRTYIVVVDGAEKDPNAQQSASWQLELESIEFNIDSTTILSTTYDNIAPQLPLIRSGSN